MNPQQALQIQAFLNEWLGKSVEVEDPTNKDQCYDWFFKYCDFLNIPHSAAEHLYAYQIYTDATDETKKYFDLIPNTKDFIPQLGDVGIFDTTVGIAGHVCVCTGVGDTNSFESTDQNWDTKNFNLGLDPETGLLIPYVRKVTHNYNGFLGVLRPKSFNQDPLVCEPKSIRDMLVTKASAFDEFIKAGYSTPQDVTTRLSALQSQNDSLTKQVGELTKEGQNLVLETQQDKNTIAQQADLLKQQAESDSTAIDAGLNASSALKEVTSDINIVATALTTTYPPVSNLTFAIELLRNEIKSGQIQQTQAAKNTQTIFNWLLNIFARKKVK